MMGGSKRQRKVKRKKRHVIVFISFPQKLITQMMKIAQKLKIRKKTNNMNKFKEKNIIMKL